MDRPKRLDFEQTFAGGFDYEEALENYCDWLEFQLEDWKKEWEYSVRVRRRCSRIYYRKEKTIKKMLELACIKLEQFSNNNNNEYYDDRNDFISAKSWEEWLINNVGD